MATTTAIRRPVELAMATPVFCDTVKWDDNGGIAVALSVAELAEEEAEMTVFVDPAPIPLASEDAVALDMRPILGLGVIGKIAASMEAVVFTTGFGSVEFVQTGAAEVCKAYDPVLSGLVTKSVGRATPLRYMDDAAELNPRVVFHPSCPKVLFEDL